MKKIISVIALSVAFAATAPAQGVLGGLLGGNTQSTLGNIISQRAMSSPTSPALQLPQEWSPRQMNTLQRLASNPVQ